MTLLELLVKELPKRGGWPKNTDAIHQDHDGGFYLWRNHSCKFAFNTGVIADNHRLVGGALESEASMVTREQYEAALAASQNPVVMLSLDEWDGSEYLGLVVGREMECHADDGTVFDVVIVAFDGNKPIAKGKKHGNYFAADPGKLKPIRSEAERKREEAINKIQSHCHVDHRSPISAGQAIALYDAIAAGKIPGVRIE